MMKIAAFCFVLFAVSAFAAGPLPDRRSIGKRSDCDGQSDGYKCVGSPTKNRLIYCMNGDELWNWPCASGRCVTNNSNSMCQFPSDSKFCAGKYTTSSRSGTYCDGDSTIVTCSQTGQQFTSGCATSATPDATCEQFSNNWAMCDYPPKCENFPVADENKLKHCTGVFSPAGRIIPVPVAENVTTFDDKAGELNFQLSSAIYPKDAASQCAYLIKSTACYVAFPDCPGHQDCLLVCGQMKNCIKYANSSTAIPDLDCESYCGQFAGANTLSYSMLLIAVVALMSVLF